MDIRAQQAREHHRRSIDREGEAGREREQRDRLVRSLRADNWTYKQIAGAVGCSPELVAHIVRAAPEEEPPALAAR